MKHSIIIRLLRRITDFTRKYYSFSTTRKLLNRISSIIRNLFIHSYIYKFFISKNKSEGKLVKFSIIGKFESFMQVILDFLNSLYRKGTKGSFVFNLLDNISKVQKRSKLQFISFGIIGLVLTYNLLSFMNKSIYVDQLYISGIMIILSINIYFIDINRLYEHSFFKKIVDSFLKI
ncbi:hypothetical protein [Maledivibacter halophilus]|uniref:Uncharacterized protein n=1 Tax=Maledivibacter halophilus TaxID=36842 RepID=A0A1T5JGX2_9FIRM|nr:hypothetical protein [Maledivibacter halophilus]SKC50635.1 hypothetical protein SAMN02194393_01175 [Maledivibacter halophilus]